MNVRKFPISKIQSWSVYHRVLEGTRHLVGYGCIEGFEVCRVSTALVEFNREAMTVKTRSGLMIELVGEPAIDFVSFYTWCCFVDKTPYIDMTEQYWDGDFRRLTDDYDHCFDGDRLVAYY
ncbi:MAG: hypothetical protein PF483_07940 [Halothiobacillus sp.]|jgi:hypothetical protein|nr:hypothetical protein [Halothiobacillus sp.]